MVLGLLSLQSDADVGDTGECLAAHVVVNADVECVSYVEVERCQHEVILVVVDTASFDVSFLIYEAAADGVLALCSV